MGLTAPEIFHRIYTEIFQDIPNAEVYIDDIIVWDEDEEKHKKTLKKIFEKARENGVKFNDKNMSIRCKISQILGTYFY